MLSRAMINFQRPPIFFLLTIPRWWEWLLNHLFCPFHSVPDSLSRCFVSLRLKEGEDDGPSIMSSFQLRWAEALPGEGANSWLIARLCWENCQSVPFWLTSPFSLEVGRWRMSLQKDGILKEIQQKTSEKLFKEIIIRILKIQTIF